MRGEQKTKYFRVFIHHHSSSSMVWCLFKQNKKVCEKLFLFVQRNPWNNRHKSLAQRLTHAIVDREIFFIFFYIRSLSSFFYPQFSSSPHKLISHSKWKKLIKSFCCLSFLLFIEWWEKWWKMGKRKREKRVVKPFLFFPNATIRPHTNGN